MDDQTLAAASCPNVVLVAEASALAALAVTGLRAIVSAALAVTGLRAIVSAAVGVGAAAAE
jgi:hypothetical protein